MQRRLAFSIAALLVCLPRSISAAHVKATLLVSGNEAALRLVHDPHWHTYWINPGDSGLATKIKPGKLDFPTPKRLMSVRAPRPGEVSLISFGYEGDVLIPVTLPPGTTRVTATWLECSDICIPGKAELRARPGNPEKLAAARVNLPRQDNSAVLAVHREKNKVVITVAGEQQSALFFPAEPGAFELWPLRLSIYGVGRDNPFHKDDRRLPELQRVRTDLIFNKGPGAPDLEVLSGILAVKGRPPVWITVPIESGHPIAGNLLLAFLGGLLLNLMPCVFPVLSIKVLSLVNTSASRSPRLEALAYTLGVVSSFLALAGALIAARAAGSSLGWGFQLQSPWVVGAMAAMFTAIGLNLLGVFEVGTKLMSLGDRAGSGSFSSGVFAVVVAAPCTAPFMGAAVGWALTRPAYEALAIFTALGLGTAAPYALLSSWPALLKRLPRPGAWMENFKRALSIPMFLTAAWLIWVLWRMVAAPVGTDVLWKTWSPEAVTQARAGGKTTFVDFTAAWCLSCQVNERVVLSRPKIREALGKGVAFKADWTDKNSAIEAELASHGRAGVPLYIVYPKGGEPAILPAILTPNIVLEALGEQP